MKRLSIVLFFALLGFGAWGWFRLNQPEPPMALTEPLRIDQGEIQGGVDPDNPEIQVFNGIPYASARRWSAPTSPPQWGAITRDAREFGPQCLQPRGHMNEVVDRIIDGNGLPWWKRLAA
ncbi:carboxylesterase family protein, partial [Hyphomonas sp. UBA3601]